MNTVRYIITILFVFLVINSFAGSRRFYGRIISTGGAGIPMSTVESKNRVYHFYTNGEGFFDFKADPDSAGLFVFSAPGYSHMDFPAEDLPDDSIIVELTKRENVLAEAGVAAKGNKDLIATSGISRGWHTAGCYLSVYDEIAVYLNEDMAKNGMVKEVGAYITKEGAPKTDFIMHIYARDSTTGGPGEEITDSVLVMHARKGNEWVTADLSDRYIQVHGGIYVSVQWIIGSKNGYYPWPVPYGASNYYSGRDSLKTLFNGQVLGLEWQDEQPKIYRRYSTDVYEHVNEGKWYLTPPLRGGHKGKDWITPMIYYTYSYVEGK